MFCISYRHFLPGLLQSCDCPVLVCGSPVFPPQYSWSNRPNSSGGAPRCPPAQHSSLVSFMVRVEVKCIRPAGLPSLWFPLRAVASCSLLALQTDLALLCLRATMWRCSPVLRALPVSLHLYIPYLSQLKCQCSQETFGTYLMRPNQDVDCPGTVLFYSTHHVIVAMLNFYNFKNI